MILNYLIKYFLLIIIFFNSFNINNLYKNDSSLNCINYEKDSFSVYIRNISDIPDIFLKINQIIYAFSSEYKIIEIKYYLEFKDHNFNKIKPSDLSLLYNLHILCYTYSFERKEKIYSFPNINNNKYFYCIEYINIEEQSQFGIKIFKIDEINEEIEFNDIDFFTNKLINNNLNPEFENNNKFNITYIYENYNQQISINNKKKKKTH